MFSKLKDKLKGALFIFSKKAEEEVTEREATKEKVKEILEEKEKKKKTDEQKKIKEKQEEKDISKKRAELEEPKESKKEEAEEREIEEEISEGTGIGEIEKEEEPTGETTAVEELREEEHGEEGLKEKELDKEGLEEKERPKTAEDLIKEIKEKFAKEKKPAEKKVPAAEDIIRETKEKFSREKKEEKEETPSAEELIKKTKEKFSKEEKKIHEEKPFAEKLVEEEEIPEKKSLFSRIKKAITTKKISADKFDQLFWDLELILLENNVSVEVIEKIKEDLKKELVDKSLPRNVPQKIEETLTNTLREVLSPEKIDLLTEIKKKKPYVITFFGINGAGKTTSIAKLAYYLQKNKLSIVLAACDTFRAAAIQQLEEHAERLGVKVIKHNYGSDAAAVGYDAIKYAEKNDIDVVLIDTAGRLHSNTNLMAELEKIIRVARPDLKIFVGESIAGNDCIEQARKFNELVKLDGAILTKADVDDKGGAPLSISYIINKPILFLGVGQKYQDLEEFDRDVVLRRLGF